MQHFTFFSLQFAFCVENAMRTLTVNLGDRSYPIHVGEKLLPHIGEFLQQVGCRGKVGIVTNPTVAALYLGPVQEGLSRSGFKVTSILLPDGEEHKNLSAARIAEKFRAANPPILGRIKDDRFLLDLRAIFDPEDLIPNLADGG